MARSARRTYARDARGRFASGASQRRAILAQADRVTRKRDPGIQPVRGAARARANSDRATESMRLARSISTKAPKNAAALQAYNAKMGKKASRSKVTAEKARDYYAGKGATPIPKKAAAASKRPAKGGAKPRGVLSRLNRSSMVLQDYQRSSSRAPGQRYGSKGQRISEMNPQKAQHMGKRVRQQKQAIANWYNSLSPANQKRARTAMRRNNVMNG